MNEHITPATGTTQAQCDHLAEIAALARENKKLRRALKEALSLFAHEFTHSDGRVPTGPAGQPLQVGGAWVLQARKALAATAPVAQPEAMR